MAKRAEGLDSKTASKRRHKFSFISPQTQVLRGCQILFFSLFFICLETEQEYFQLSVFSQPPVAWHLAKGPAYSGNRTDLRAAQGYLACNARLQTWVDSLLAWRREEAFLKYIYIYLNDRKIFFETF